MRVGVRCKVYGVRCKYIVRCDVGGREECEVWSYIMAGAGRLTSQNMHHASLCSLLASLQHLSCSSAGDFYRLISVQLNAEVLTDS